MINEVKLVDFDPEHRITFESSTGPTPFRYAYRLDPTDHGTRTTLVGRISPEALPGPIAHLDGIATQLFKRGMQRNLRTLERLLTSGVATNEGTFGSNAGSNSPGSWGSVAHPAGQQARQGGRILA